MVIGIVVTHGGLAGELLETAKKIYGDFAGCYPVTNTAKSPQVLCDEIEQILVQNPDQQAVILVDFFGGSCSHACLQVEHARPNVQVISGVNLPMVLAFLNKREDTPFDNLADEIISRAQDSIRRLDPSKI